MKERILIVEDEQPILTGLIDLFKSEGFLVFYAKDGVEALRQYQEKKPDVILLDVMIPEKSGYDVCKEIRKIDPLVSVVILTAKGEEVDKVVGLELGADDYVVKPFSTKELVSRIRAVLRRSHARALPKDDSPIVFGGVTIDTKAMAGKKGKETFEVTQREIQLLRLFLAHDGEVLDRFTILDQVWGIKYEGTTRTLDQHIVKLRQKIEDEASKPRHIVTVHTVGYQFFSNPKD